ncbi:MAG: hypothetical protein BRC31_03985 [Actinobacteria bacterium QS_5_72_10]|nr:MAG: hypothetical protein BRC31_03985 [Actinobacteria bacterium QS_5_72_10]
MPIPRTEAGTVDALAAELLAVQVDYDPVGATSVGVYERVGELPEPTEAAAQAHNRDLAALAERVARHDVGGDVGAGVDRDGLLARIAHERLSLAHQPAHRTNPMAVVLGLVQGVFVLLARDHLPDALRVEGLRGRCAGARAYLDAARASLVPAEVPPEWVAMAQATGRGAQSLLGEQLPAALPQVGDDALASFTAWLGEELAPAAGGEVAAGEEAMAALLGQAHLVDASPSQVAARGEELCARTDELLVEASGRRDWQAALNEAKADHPDQDGLLDAYRAAFQDMTRACRDADVVTDPGVEALVEPSPPFLRSLLTYAAYFGPGEFEDGGQGRLWVTPPSDDAGLADHSHATIPSIVAHEGYPGHHLQITAVGRNPGVMRRLRVSTLMTEGWGLYTEELMAELGAPAEAADRLSRETGLSQAIARAEVGRYTMTPAQPFSYLYGAEQIRALRADWRQATGGTLRAFHDALLAYGHLPPSLAARAMLASA